MAETSRHTEMNGEMDVGEKYYSHNHFFRIRYDWVL